MTPLRSIFRARRRGPFLLGAAIVSIVSSTAPAAAQTCGEWQPADVQPASSGFQAVAWAGSRFVAVGAGLAYASSDGQTWTRLGAAPWFVTALAWTGSQLIGAGRYAGIATSPDGATWTTRREPSTGSPPSTGLVAVTAGGPGAVAVGFYPTESSGAFGHPWVFTSPDAVTWSEVATPAGADREDLSAVVWTGGRFVAVGSSYPGGLVLTSPDGRHWTRQSGPGGAALAWSGEWLAALAPGASSLVAARSRDGVSWETRALGAGFVPHGMAWDGARFVAAGDGGAIYSSGDGLAWSEEARPASDIFAAVTARAGIRVAVGMAGAVVSSVCRGTPGEALWLPAAAHVSGLAGSEWRTDLLVHNPGGADLAVEVALLLRDAENLAPASQVLVIPAGTSARYPDIVKNLFGLEGAGTLRIVPYGGTVVAGARTYSEVGAGTFGQYLGALRDGTAIGAGREARVIGLAQSSDPARGFRTNLGVVSACAVPLDVLVELVGGEGHRLGTATVRLRPFESVQITEILHQFTTADVADAVAIVRTQTAGGRFFAYGSVVDNRSNDPACALAE